MRKAAWVIAVGGSLVLAAAALCGLIHLGWGDRPMPPLAGNNPPGGLQCLDTPKTKYRVGVLGDSQKGLANLRNVVRAVQAEGVDFILQTGDLVSNNDDGHYRLVSLALERAPLQVRMVVVPGNHDIKGSPVRFEHELGEGEFRFKRDKVVYVVLDNSAGWPPKPAALEKAMEHLDPEMVVVMAMHVPPFDREGAIQAGYRPFLDWLEKSRVKYLLCGHVHGYFKKQVGGTTVIINGVGGDYDKWQLDQKVHATILEVDGTTITDRAIELPPEHNLRVNLEHLAIGHLAEAYKRSPILYWGATLLVAALVGFSIGFLRKPYGKMDADRASPVP